MRGGKNRNLSQMLSQKLKPTLELNPLRRWYGHAKYFLIDNWQRVWVMALWIGVMAGLFAWKFVQYQNIAAWQSLLDHFTVQLAPRAADEIWYGDSDSSFETCLIEIIQEP
ncbi:NAD(P)H oxidase (H2O2-forming) [Sarracenia purpurea var. burkii]